MEKSLEQLKHIQRISRQTRHHRTYLNQICDQSLRTQLNHLAAEREQSLTRSASRRELEEQRKQLLTITVKQLAREQESKSLPVDTVETEEESIQIFPENDESRPSSSVKLPSAGKSCRLFSQNCQLYPCQPVYQYTSITKREFDKFLRKRDSPIDPWAKSSDRPYLQEIFSTIHEKKHQQHRRQLASAIQNQHHQTKRYVSMERTMATLDEQSRSLHEQLADKKTFGYVRERQQQLSQAIQRHLNITAKFCA